MTEKNKCYGIQVQFDKLRDSIVIYNGNSFEVNELNVCIQENKKKCIYYINTLDSFTEWEEKTQGDISKSGMGSKREVFRSFGYFQGKPHIIDEKLFHTDTGIYEGTPHDALVWPDADSDERWRKQLTFHLKVNNAEVTIGFIARGPKIAFCGHSFTGLWDSAYYYFRELAKMGGWNARLAYSYWGGTGLGHYAGLVEGCEERAKQCEKLINGNEYYDFFIVAGNSDEALETYSGKVGATDYKQRPYMLRGAELIHEKMKGKAGRMLLWAPHAYQYGFLKNMRSKPWYEGTLGDTYNIDGQEYVLTLTSEQMAAANMEWYDYIAKELGEDVAVLPVCLVYAELRKQYGLSINPYISPEQGGDYGHQNNIGNYIAACLLYAVIFDESPEGLGIPVSHTFGMSGGIVTQEQANIIQRIAWEVYENENQRRF